MHHLSIKAIAIGTISLAASLGLLALSGCDRMDPLSRPYMWREGEVNSHNIALMAANPADLTHGRDAPRRRVSMESDGVERVWAGKPAALPSDTPGSSSSSSTGGSGGGTSTAPGGS